MAERGVEIWRAVDKHFLLFFPKRGAKVKWHEFLAWVEVTKDNVKRMRADPGDQEPHLYIRPFHVDYPNDILRTWENIWRAAGFPSDKITRLLDKVDAFNKLREIPQPLKKGSRRFRQLFKNFDVDPKECAALLSLSNYPQEHIVGLMNVGDGNLKLVLEELDHAGILPAFDRSVVSGIIRVDNPSAPERRALTKGIGISTLQYIAGGSIRRGIPAKVEQHDDDGRQNRALEAVLHHVVHTPLPREVFLPNERLLANDVYLENIENNNRYESTLRKICMERVLGSGGLPPVIPDIPTKSRSLGETEGYRCGMVNL